MKHIPQMNPEYILDSDGNKKAVILPIEEYQELLEDLDDLAVIAERRDENTVPHHVLMEELEKMVIYQIEWKASSIKDLKQIDRSIIKLILKRINLLQNEPRPPGVRKLQGTTSMYRIRVGNYRVIYEINDNVLLIYVIRVRHRKDVYKKGK